MEITKHLSIQFDTSMENALLYNNLTLKIRNLQKTEERFKLAIDGSAVGIWDWDVQTDKVFYSNRFKELLGYEPEDISDSPDEFWTRLHPDNHSVVKQAIVSHLKKQDPFNADCRIQTKSGEYRWFHARGQAKWNDMGKATRMSGTLIDINKRKQGELDLKTVQEYLDTILFNIPLGVAILEGPEFRYFRVNKVLAELNELSVEEHLGKTLEEVLPPKTVNTVLPNLRKVYENGETIFSREFNLRLGSNSAKEFYLIDWHFPITVDGGIQAVGAIVMDITERRQLEKKIKKQNEQLKKTNQELSKYHKNLEKLVEERTSKLNEEIVVRKEAEQKFFSVLNSAPDAMVIVNDEGNILLVNRQTEKVFGYAKEELIGKSVEHLMPERFRGKYVDFRIGYAKAPKIREMGTNLELFALRKDGSEFPIDVSLSPINTGEDRLIIAILRDVTEHKKSEKLLKESEALFRTIYEYAPIMMDSFDKDGRCNLWNRECEKVFGWTEEEIFSHKNPLELFYPDPKIRKQVINTVSSKPEGTYTDWNPKTKDGRVLTCSWANFKLPDGKIINLGYDITERKKAEKEIERQREILAKLDRNTLMGQLTGAIAHELNQPLTSILSNAQTAEIMLKSGNWDVEEFKEILIDIIKDTKRGAEIIGNVREMYREQKVEFLPFNLIETINSTVRLLNSELVMQNIMIDIKCTAFTPILYGNMVQIQQVLVNLIINSIDAMQNINRSNRQLQIQTTNNDNEVRTTVTDSGSGIITTEINNIFKPFTTTKSEGIGMGLAVSNSIIESHGGRMWAENGPEGGTLVGFSLPFIKKEF
ncbi:MAG: PAS domain S-box protein [Bacteroidetes bacterium]|nr:PAS domain S-box protein [Bacteroidota bacterium]